MAAASWSKSAVEGANAPIASASSDFLSEGCSPRVRPFSHSLPWLHSSWRVPVAGS